MFCQHLAMLRLRNCSLDSFSDVRHQSTGVQDIIDDARVRACCICRSMNQKPSRPGIDLNLIAGVDPCFELGAFKDWQPDIDSIAVKNTGETDGDYTRDTGCLDGDGRMFT